MSVPCFDPTCDCCTGWRGLVDQLEDHIRALRSAGEDALTAMRNHDDMDLPTHPAYHEYGQLDSAVQAVRHV